MNAYQEWLILDRQDCYTFLGIACVLFVGALSYLGLQTEGRWVFQAQSVLFLCVVPAILLLWRIFQIRRLLRKESEQRLHELGDDT